MEVKTLLPVFILKTRSFWLGIFPALLTIFEALMAESTSSGTAGPIAESLAFLFSGIGLSWTAAAIHGFMVKFGAVYTLIVAQQRSGITRPYAATPGRESSSPAAVLVKEVEAAATKAVQREVTEAVDSISRQALRGRIPR